MSQRNHRDETSSVTEEEVLDRDAQAEPADVPNEGTEAQATDGSVGASASESTLQQELESVKQQLVRTYADFDNFRKRTRQEKEELQSFATRKLLSDILPVVDNFDRALSSLPGEGDIAQLRAGVEMVHRQLLGVLEKNGVQPMTVIGEQFDPTLHEAVMQEQAGDGDSNIVVQELQRGYFLHDKVLRPAMVKVTV